METKAKAEDDAATKCLKEADEAAKKKAEQQKSDAANTSDTTTTAETQPGTSTEKTTKTTSGTTSGTTDTSSSGGNTTDPAAKQKEAEEHKNNAAKYRTQASELRKKKRTAAAELQGTKGQEGLGKYVSEDYSSIYGTPQQLNNMRSSVKELYEDIPNPSNSGIDYYKRGHFIRDQWALRYETLGQDLDTEGRILIDENA